jgi:hypothetical protein
MKKSELDLLVRNEVRKFLKENYGMAEAPRAAGRQKKAPDAEKETAMHTEDGDTFEEIAEEMGLSVAGAHAAVQKAMAKFEFLATLQFTDPNDLEKIVLAGMDDYIKLLKKSGELSAEDVKLLKQNPDIVRTLDGFREHLHKFVKRAKKSKYG